MRYQSPIAAPHAQPQPLLGSLRRPGLLQAMQQFTGMNVIMYYAPKIFELAGYTNTTEQMWGTVLIGTINVLATFIATARRGMMAPR